MKKLLGMAAVLALVLAACGGNPGALAATVDGTRITVGDVNELIHIESGTITKEQFAEFLGYRIQWVLVENGAGEEFGIMVSEDEIRAEADRIYEEFSQPEESREDFTSSRGVTEEFLLQVSHQGLLDERLRARFLDDSRGVLTEEEIDERVAGETNRLTEVCASHILLGQLVNLEGDELEEAATEAEAEAADVLARLANGEDFSDLAMEVSADEGSGAFGGDLGCVFDPEARYVEAFAEAVLTAPVGEVLDEAVRSQFGYHVILVNSRTVPTEEEVVDSLNAGGIATALEEWVLGVFERAEVSVEPRFGTWEATPQPRVVPPAT